MQTLPIPSLGRPELSTDFVGPRTELEQQLVSIWEELLGVHPIGVEDDFFDLGGDSIIASQLFVRIDNLVGRAWPVTTLLEAPTVGQLAQFVSSDQRRIGSSALIPIQPAGSRSPIFFIHSSSGHILFYTRLARHLNSDQPVYGLQTALDEEGQPLFTEVGDMASYYLHQIRSVQPEGPYYLGGLCTAGNIAFEMAQQLQEEGQDVALLAMLDTPLPSSGPMASAMRLTRNAVSITRRLAYKTRLNLRRGPAALLELVPELAGEIKGLIDSQPIPEANRKAGRRYVARDYCGTIEMFLPEKKTFGFSRRQRLAWKNLASGGFHVHYVPGNQSEMMREPHVQVLARQLEKCMDAKPETAALDN